MVDALAKVAGWKLSQYGVYPSATTKLTSAGGTGTKYAAGVVATLPTVNAHQNTSYTLCPGQYLSPLMATIRSKATLYAKHSSTTAPAPVTDGQAVRGLRQPHAGLRLDRVGGPRPPARAQPSWLRRRDGGRRVRRRPRSARCSASRRLRCSRSPARSRPTTGARCPGSAYVKTGAPPPPAPPRLLPRPQNPCRPRRSPASTPTDAVTSSAAPGPATSTSTPPRSAASGPRCGSAAAGTPTARSSPPATSPATGSPTSVAVTSTGSAYLFKGNGKGGLLAGRTLLSQHVAGLHRPPHPGRLDR